MSNSILLLDASDASDGLRTRGTLVSARVLVIDAVTSAWLPAVVVEATEFCGLHEIASPNKARNLTNL